MDVQKHTLTVEYDGWKYCLLCLICVFFLACKAFRALVNGALLDCHDYFLEEYYDMGQVDC